MNIIAKMWLYCLLAPHKQKKGHGEDYIKSYLKANVDHDGEFIPMNTENDFGFFWITHKEMVLSIRGTHGLDAWKNNAKFWPTGEGFETGFYEGARAFWPMVKDVLKDNHHRKLLSGHQSRGCPIGQILTLWAMEELHKWSKPMLYDPPTPWDERGDNRYHKAGLQAINLISPNDIVDNVGTGILGGVHTGTMIFLPVTREKGIEGLKDMIPGWGHSYSETTDGLIKYFYENRQMPKEAEYLKSIRHLATI